MMARRVARSMLGLVCAGALGLVGACGGGESSGEVAAIPPVSASVEGGGLAATATIRAPRVTMADLVRVELDVETDRADVVSVDVAFEATDEWAGGRRERNESRRGGADSGGRLVRSTLVFEPFLPGDLETPPITLTPVLRDGARGEPLTIEPMGVEVASVIEGDPEGAELADVKGVVDAPALSRVWWIAGGVAAACVALGALVAGIVMARRRPPAPVPARPAHEVAFEALERLRERGLVRDGLMREYYFELSRILRRYIEERFGLRAPEQTTEEFLREARGCGALGTRDVELLERFLEHCDMVKFAKLEVVREQAELSMETVRDFVDRTRLEAPGPGGGVAGPADSAREVAA